MADSGVAEAGLMECASMEGARSILLAAAGSLSAGTSHMAPHPEQRTFFRVYAATSTRVAQFGHRKAMLMASLEGAVRGRVAGSIARLVRITTRSVVPHCGATAPRREGEIEPTSKS